MRRRGMRTFLVAVIAAGGLLAGATASHATTPAATLAAEATDFRADAVSMLRGYERDLGPELTAAERSRVRALVVDARTRLIALERSVSRLEAAPRSQRERIRSRAIAQHASARIAAERATDELAPLAASRLGLGELLAAKADLDRMLNRFDDLGDAIRAA